MVPRAAELGGGDEAVAARGERREVLVGVGVVAELVRFVVAGVLLDQRVEPYRALLSSDPDLMRDEFGVSMEAVERVTGRRGSIPDDEDRQRLRNGGESA